MTRVLMFVAVAGTMLGARGAAACDPWTDVLDLGATAIRAGLVVVAHRSDSTVTLVSDDPPWEAFASFDVERVLKGAPLDRRISVATAWLHGKGIQVSPGESVALFLERHGDRYYPVRDGCSVATVPIKDGLEAAALRREFGFAWAAAPGERQLVRVPALVVLAVAFGGAGFTLGHLVGRRR